MSKDKYQKQWEVLSQRMEKVNSELLSLTYGTLVTQLLKDFEQIDAINAQLEKMGYNIGIRLVDEFLAKTGMGGCTCFRQTADVVAKLGLRMFLGVTADVTNWDADGTSCSLILHENPLADFVELPPSLSQLSYSNLICGVIRGALEQLQMRVTCQFVRDMLKGDDCYEIRLELTELIREEFIDDEDN
ncbi:putative trafficking protein particle complex subunit 3 [Neospora caninum Liverpool]|uniref:Trafficking protein particle complex subunit n=1 Tax=Neospora caninum (strain Liverpool) TaxID=572307 RepID=F0V9N6_NEOCL|nr:putative trafficking protein particle complex subunit 3 [Neospora caninum Liverpool]CBZ50462.1 putative trafficking protein particle complex subunit 3 [Neospora caninum Liverpool]CEL65071.1 TPA: trafficking protein particle complex subunit 3,putative [Neospora caninum Liverpool]|eukprot:XP_003880495.1 putative trafficking protein particle complex subunit 3 [Neospora caninum Liverpool]